MASTQEIIKYGTMDDLIFRGRNKAYGAFYLRQVYNSHLKKSLLYLFSFAMSGILTYAIHDRMNYVETTSLDPIKDTTRLITFDQHQDIPEPKPIEPVASNEPAPTDQVVPPNIVDKVIEDIPAKPTVEIDNGTTAIGGQTIEGSPSSNPNPGPSNPTLGSGGGDAIVEGYETDISAEFPGGEPALIRYLENNIKYPDFENENEISGSVVLQFVVNKDGSISNIEIIKKDRQGFNRNAVDVVTQMPHWRPAMVGSHPVRSYFELPINFTQNRR
jgi:periplasmic protein TonB